MRIIFLVVLICIGWSAPVRAQQFITVDFSTGQLWHLYGEGQRDVYQVVLPKETVQREMNLSQPVIGQYVQADHKPTWWPTANMRARKPSLPREVRYGQSEHPIGIYRLRVDWQNPRNPDFWLPVRIHGGAKLADLNEAESAGCVRMLDEDIVRLVTNIKQARGHGETDIKVSFGFFNNQ